MTRDGLGQTALITGASAGIGAAFAVALAVRGYDLLLTARRTDRLEALAVSLREAHGVAVDVQALDLAESDAPARLVEWVGGRRVDLLVNNAGYGVAGRYTDADWTTHARFLQVMVTAVCEVTHRVLPGMLARGYGRIIHVASLAGQVPAPAGHTLYAASKAFLIRAAEALHAEYASRGIHCTAVCPGFTYTEFHDVLGTRDRVSRLPRWVWQSAPDVVEEGYAAVMRGTPVHITGRVNRLMAWLARVVPPATARRMVAGAGSRFRRTH
ncbi:MAG: SDR family oxidoreductase [Acidobacteria bacterium]|nr:SDR family oxidoreductase [Acidobacteriota bacterium]